jgi:mannose-1-phosphate guanylyltransferase/mannose-1-phosphate guanylyltransferase/mannose-6-phosphate isomerase
MSRASYPKQLCSVGPDGTMLQETIRRVRNRSGFGAPLIVCNAAHRFVVAEQVRETGVVTRRIVLESSARGTAPAVAAAAELLHREDPDAWLLVLPADHLIRDVAALHDAVETGRGAAREGALVTFGVPARSPQSGFGYVQRGATWPGIPGCYVVTTFVEKPNAQLAAQMIATDGCYWNSGIFLFRADAFLAEYERVDLDSRAACREAVETGTPDRDFFRLGEAAFAHAHGLAIDRAVMEKTNKAAVVPVDMGWSDVGSWATLWEVGSKDDAGNVVVGDAVLDGVRNCYVRGGRRLVAAVGLEDAIIIVTDDVVLALKRDEAQKVQQVVRRLRQQARPEADSHPKAYQPWGSHQTIHAGPGYRMRRILVNPGIGFCPETHERQAGHLVVASGAALIVCAGGEKLQVGPSGSASLPVRWIENPGPSVLELIEMQSGARPTDDIV